MWFVAAPIVNGNFIPHTPVMWTPPTYDDLMARDAAVAVILLRVSGSIFDSITLPSRPLLPLISRALKHSCSVL